MSTPQQVEEQKKIVEEHYAQAAEEATPEEALSTSADTDDPAASTDASNTSDEETYKQRYLTLQGKYNQEVPRLHQALREQQTRTQGLEQLLASVQQQAARPVEPVNEAAHVTDEDKAAYGDSIDVMRRVCRDEVSDLRAQVSSLVQVVRQMTDSVVPRVNEVTQRQARSDESMFWNTLSSIVPDWKDINERDQFKRWLLEYDPMAGVTRQTLLEIAHKNLDAQRVASFFTTWQSLTGETSVQKGAGQQRKASQLEAQISPGRGRTFAPSAQNASKTITAADVAKFYEDVRMGKYRGREEEQARTERDIFLAGREGRIK